ncbi:phosphatidylglycerophosphatase A [Lyticum sinuosum]|uniref:Phosphatidylglycerophosphatase A n=1 Tax=Lyticum sinuosum TaxID=1332059 RepID=A0AAE4VLA9_9RICK|nr:phosphatidylglycerophosphatase A [Lyticum sinuosum]MDZ5761618.1 Phosphatidylglycerophosphatase A [Lyticum sinuosum]
MVKIIAQWFGLGRIKYAPGTFGSLGALPICYILILFPYFISQIFEYEYWKMFWIIFIVIELKLLILGYYSIGKFTVIVGVKDHKSIVIDEVIGQVISFAILFFLTISRFPSQYQDFISLPVFFYIFFISFFFFRIFDIFKPFGIRWLDKNIDGTTGVIIDDIAAGIIAGIISSILYRYFILNS